MLNRSQRLGLAMESLDELGIACEGRSQDLEGNVPIDGAVVRAEDVGHATAADTLRDLVTAADEAHEKSACKQIADLPILPP
jgi:hypothetical protein